MKTLDTVMTVAFGLTLTTISLVCLVVLLILWVALRFCED